MRPRPRLMAAAAVLAFATAAFADHWERISYEIAAEAHVTGPDTYQGSIWVEWGAVEGADECFVHHRTGAKSDVLIAAPDHTRSILVGNGAAKSASEFIRSLRAEDWRGWFEVWAHFPSGDGTLETVKRADVRAPVAPGSVVPYTIWWRNVGVHPISDAQLVEQIPQHMTYVGGGHPTGSAITWDLGRLAPGQSGFVTFLLRLDDDIPDGTRSVYNVAVARTPDGAPSPQPGDDPPESQSEPAGIVLSTTDYLVCRLASADAEWIDGPSGSAWTPLLELDCVRGGDAVRVNAGHALFRHTVATGEFSATAGSFSMTPHDELPKGVLSEIVLAQGIDARHRIGGILNAAETVSVRTRHLAARVHEADYRVTDDGTTERFTVRSGSIKVTDPAGAVHDVNSAFPYAWPATTKAAAAGPQIVATSPRDHGSSPYDATVVAFTFDEPVTSIGPASTVSIASTTQSWSFSGTIAALSGAGTIWTSWNAAMDEFRVGIPEGVGNSNTTQAITLSLALADVAGASGTAPRVVRTVEFYRPYRTYSGGWLDMRAGGLFVHHEQGWDRWVSPVWERLTEMPGTAPEGLVLASPVWHFGFPGGGGDVSSVALQSRLAFPPPAGVKGTGGLFRHDGTNWTQLTDGFGDDWTQADGLEGRDFVLALFAKPLAPAAPKVTSVLPAAATPAAADAPLVLTVEAPWGIDPMLTQVRVNGVRAFVYDPPSRSVPHWTIEEADGVTTLTYTPPGGWTAGQCVFGTADVVANWGGLVGTRDFAFTVAFADRTDADRDRMPDAWEEANGTDKAKSDRNADPDGDGFANWTELTYGTSPRSSASAPVAAETVRGTVGTKFPLRRSGAKAAKFKVYVGTEVRPGHVKLTAARLDAWDGDSGAFLLKKALPAGPYSVWVRIGAGRAAMVGGVEVVAPAIESAGPAFGAAGDTVRLTGTWFGSVKPLVALEPVAGGKRIACKVAAVTMDAATGASTLDFVVPAKAAAGAYRLVLDNKAGSVAADFEVR